MLSVFKSSSPVLSTSSCARETRDNQATVMVVDDDPSLRRAMTRSLQRAGYQVHAAESAVEATALLSSESFDAVVSDINMPTTSGIGLLKLLRKLDEDLPVILATGAPAVDTAIEAVRHGAMSYLTKPFEPAALIAEVRRAVALGRMARLRQQAQVALAAESAADDELETLEEHFDSALGGLHMAYQPIVSWPARQVIGYEALMRSSEPALPHPGALIDAAERLGRVQDLGRTVRERCVTPMPELPSDVLLFVNLHTHELLDEQLFDARSPLATVASRVVLEITERAHLDEVGDVDERIKRLRRLGFRIAIDDIGAGYAGLTSFARLEPDVVKLDMALIRNIDSAPLKQRLVRSMIELCADLDIRVVAEGVETVAERDMVSQLGCELIQGYLFGRPSKPFSGADFGAMKCA